MTSRRLVVAAAAFDAVVEHAREGAPNEVCGVLVGNRDALHVDAVRRVPNVASTPETRYELDPERTLSTLDAVESAGRDVVGFYHSHPCGPDGPSATDEAQATWTDYVYAIVSLAADPQLGAWRWTGTSFAPLDVEIRDDRVR